MAKIHEGGVRLGTRVPQEARQAKSTFMKLADIVELREVTLLLADEVPCGQARRESDRGEWIALRVRRRSR
jgi:hypothetical protein